MSYVDFYFASVYGACDDGTLKKFKEKMGVDIFEPYPKLSAIAEAIRGLDSMKDSDLIDLPEKFGMKDEVLEAYSKL